MAEDRALEPSSMKKGPKPGADAAAPPPRPGDCHPVGHDGASSFRGDPGGPDHETVLLEQGNVSTVNHAEAVLARTADLNFTPDYLWDCTLYTTVEPCAMCAATQYWANIGRLVYWHGRKAPSGSDP